MNQYYPKYKEAVFSTGGINLLTDAIHVLAVSGAYVFSAAHDFQDDVSAGVIAESPAIAGKSVTGGTFRGDNFTPAYTAVATDIEGLIIFKKTGSAATSPLLAFLDTGFTHVQNGGNVNLLWHVNGIFSI